MAAKDTRGLKRLRAGKGRVPSYECDNCKCKRYSPCTCTRKGGKQVQVETPVEETKETT